MRLLDDIKDMCEKFTKNDVSRTNWTFLVNISTAMRVILDIELEAISGVPNSTVSNIKISDNIRIR